MGKGDLPTCAACSNKISDLENKCAVIGLPGHYHDRCAALLYRTLDDTHRAALTMLRKAAKLEDKHVARGDLGGHMIMCKLIENDIRARITALEEEGKS